MLVGNKADLSNLRAVSVEDAESFAEKENIFFMETSALESLNVDNAFTEVLTQIYCISCKQALDGDDDPGALPEDHTINEVLKKDLSDVKSDGAAPDLASSSHFCSESAP